MLYVKKSVENDVSNCQYDYKDEGFVVVDDGWLSIRD